jgi:hypothetical protein
MINSNSLQPRREPELLVQAGGRVSTAVRYGGEVSNPWHMGDFPFEQAEFVIRLVSLRYSNQELQLRATREWTGRADDLSIPDWEIGQPTTASGTLTLSRVGRVASTYEFRIPAKRLADAYIYKAIFPLSMIVLMSWMVFWINPSQLGPQLSLGSTSVLTLIAFQFTMNGVLPKVGYFTAMDQYILGSSVIVFAALGEAVATGNLASRGRVDLALRLDRISRWLFPSVYGIVVLATLVL